MAIRKAEIKMHDLTAGWLTQDEKGYHFVQVVVDQSKRDAANKIILHFTK